MKNTDEWPLPEPLTSEIPRPDFPTHALPAPLRDYAEALAADLRISTDLPALFSLAPPTLLASKYVWIEVKPGWLETPNLYVALSGPSGDMKSVVADRTLEPAYRWQDGQQAKYRETADSNIAERESVEGAIKDLRRQLKELFTEKLSGEDTSAAITQVNDQIVVLRKKLEALPSDAPTTILDDATPEGATRVLAETDGRGAVLSSESNVFDQCFGLYGGGRSNIDIYLKAWSGDRMHVLRGGVSSMRKADAGGAVEIRDPRLSIFVATQPSAAREVFNSERLAGRGLAQRFLVAEPPSAIGSRPVDDPTTQHCTDAIESAWFGVVDRLSTAVAGGARPTLSLSSEAADRYHRQWAPAHEQRMAPGGDLSHDQLRGFGSKICSYVPRLAALLHVIQHPDLDDLTVSASTVDDAISLAEYFVEHRLRIAGEAIVDPELARAEHLSRWLQRGDGQRFKQTDAYDAPANRSIMQRKSENTVAPLRILQDHGWIRRVDVPRKHGGAKGGRRPAPEFEVNPNVLQLGGGANNAENASNR